MSIYKKIEKQRKILGLTIKEFTKLSGISSASLQRYKTNPGQMSLEKVYSAAKVLNVTASYLVDESEENLLDVSNLSDDEIKIIYKYRQLEDSSKQLIKRALSIR